MFLLIFKKIALEKKCSYLIKFNFKKSFLAQSFFRIIFLFIDVGENVFETSILFDSYGSTRSVNFELGSVVKVMGRERR